MMFKVIYLNNLNYDDAQLHNIMDNENYSIDSVTSSFDYFKKIYKVYYNIAIIAYDFKDVDINVLINTTKFMCNGIKVITIFNSDIPEKNKLLCSNTDMNIELSNECSIAFTLIEKFILKTFDEFKNYIYLDTEDITIDLIKQVVMKKGNVIKLSEMEYRLLECLATNPNQDLSRQQIEKLVWGNNISEFDLKVIDVHILHLRRKLNTDIIKTIRGIGYCLRI